MKLSIISAQLLPRHAFSSDMKIFSPDQVKSLPGKRKEKCNNFKNSIFACSHILTVPQSCFLLASIGPIN